MALDEHQKRTLLTNLARDMQEAKEWEHTDISEEDRARGEYALQRALESAQRMVANLEAAMKLSEEISEEARDDNEEPSKG